MKTEKEKKEQLLTEVNQLRLRVTELEAAQAKFRLLEDEIKKDNRRIVAILESITAAFFTVDGQWCFTYLNKQAEHILRRKREELLGKNMWEEYPETIDSTFFKEYHKAVDKRIAVTFEEYYPPFGIWVQAHAYPSEEGLSVYFEDITKEKQEETFRARLTAILEITSDFVSTADVDGHVQYFNKSAKKMLGLGEDEDTSGFMIRNVHPEWASKLILGEGVPTAIRQGIWEGETAVLHRSGREIPVSQVILAHKGPDGTVEFLSTIMRDISERKHLIEVLRKARAELEVRVDQRTAELSRAIADLRDEVSERKRIEEFLRESEQRFRRLSEATFEGIVIHEGGKVLEVNDVYSRMFGYKPSELIGRYALDIVLTPESREKVAEIIRLGSEEPYEAMAVRKDGTTFPIEVNAKPLLYQGRVARVAAVRDITDRKRVEQFREEYISLISHDLRAPLTVILGQAEWLNRLLYQKGLDREVRSAESVVKSAKRMNAMIQDLLESVRLESGRLEIHKEPADLLHLVKDIAEHVGTVEDRARLRVEAPDWVSPITIDSNRIERVIVNLITNALKFSPSDTPVIIRIERIDKETVTSVADQGIGISAEDQPYLFQRFFKARTGKKTEGLGLGLYISRLIVETHGGHIWVESEEGKGSTFYFSLPVA